jgi:phenylacetate-CoA ligase
MIFQPEVETLERGALERLQRDRLSALVDRIRATNDFYSSRLKGVQAPVSLGDLPALPFTHKADLRDNYPLGMLAAPLDSLARIHASSGTTGNPTVAAYTAGDLAIFAEVAARSLAGGGMVPGEMFQVMWGYGLFTGGLGMHGGGERLGLCVVPASSGNTVRQLQLLEALPVAGIGATPSYALLIAERLRHEGRRAKALRVAICGAEAWTYEMREQIERDLGVQATNIYGLTEIIGPGVSQECIEGKDGLHIQEDHFLPEIVDPQSGEPLPDGTRGELVLTTLTREAMPVLRYRTGDLTTLNREKCVCGRTTARMAWVTGRVDDMITVRGVNVFPTAIEEILLRFPELVAHYRIYVDRPGSGLDEVLVEVEHAPDAHVGDVGELARHVRHRLSEGLAVAVDARVLAPGSIERIEAGKAKRVYDRRNITS